MVKKMAGGLDEVEEEGVRVFALIVIEPCYRPWIQVLVKNSAVISPLASVFHKGDVP